jgi:diguanylate cyclase (GGDEF)-like protein/PAS domain S-box-containing protein
VTGRLYAARSNVTPLPAPRPPLVVASVASPALTWSLSHRWHPHRRSQFFAKCLNVQVEAADTSTVTGEEIQLAGPRPMRLIAWLTLSELPAPLALAVITALFPVSWAAAYWLGGADVVAPHWFYLPIFLAGLRFGPAGALAAGATASFVAGPLLPADVATGAPQATSEWVSQGIFFILIGEMVTYLFIAVRRVAARAAQAEAQSEGQQRFRALVQRATDMITVIDETGCLKYESPAVERILGWPAGHRLGLPAERFLHPDDRRAADAARRAVLADPARSQTIELRLLDSLGTWRWVESTLTNLLDEPTVRGMVINHRVVEERKALEDELIHRAFHDSLTGLANRGLLRGRIVASMKTAKAGGCRASVLFIDIDDFKTVNDGLGHDAGDRLLVEMSDRLAGCVRPQDMVARLGGDEFAVLIEDTAPGGAVERMVSQRIIDALRDPFEVSGHQAHVSASIGISTFDPGATDADSVLMQADIAMYRAKANGKNQYVFFTEEMQQGVLHRLDVESWLRDALTGNQIRVYYQPIVSLSDRRVEGAEALVRWQHPTLGLLSPGDFLDVAEETGLIVPLGKLVLREACRQVRRWREAYDEHLMVSVNLSAAQLRDPGIVAAVRSALTETGVGPGALMIEVTEGALIGDVAGATSVLESLSALGITIAIDDFGTGYSSLSHLQQFPVDVIKVDKTFVDGLCGGHEEATLVRSVLAIGSEFGLQVVAEGIQSEEQDGELRRLGCDYGQGYFYATPVPAPWVDEMLGIAPALSATA